MFGIAHPWHIVRPGQLSLRDDTVPLRRSNHEAVGILEGYENFENPV
jgi:hypothetical protein